MNETRRPNGAGVWVEAGVVALALGAIALAAYATSFATGFTLDSTAIILGAPQIRSATAENLAVIFTRDYWYPSNLMGLYRPLTTLSYLANWALPGGGDQPFAYHVVNLALHVANAVLAFAVARRVVGLGRRPALVAAAIFAAHPIGTEAVTNVVGRADLLATASVLGGLLLYARAARSVGGTRIAWLGAAAAVFLGGLLCKESAVVLLPVAILHDWIFSAARSVDSREDGRGFWHHATGWAFLLVPLAAVVLVRARIFAVNPATELDVAQNVIAVAGPWTGRATALGVLADSIGRLAWPARLCPDYSVGEVTLFRWQLHGWQDWRVVVGLALLVAGVAAPLLLRRRRPAIAFYVGFLLVAILPTSNLLVPIGAVAADRFLYLPLVGFAALVALAIEGLAGALAPGGRSDDAPSRVPAIVASALAAALVLAYGWRTNRHNLDWRDDLTLWTRASETCPASYKSHQALAAAMSARDPEGRDIDAVISLQEKAVWILRRNAPDDEPVPGHVLERLGGYYLQKASIEAAPATEPSLTEGQRRLAGMIGADWAMLAAKTLETAAYRYERENRARHERTPSNGMLEVGTPALYMKLGQAYILAREPNRALRAFKKARMLAAGDVGIYMTLADTYLRLGRNDRALMSLLEALLVAPDRRDIPPLILAVYKRVEPGGCAFTQTETGVRVDRDCPTTHRWVCRSYADLVKGFRSAKNTTAEERRAAIDKFAGAAERDFGCTGLRASDGI
ncbi:MAG TPA: hypothetical protein VFD92_23800 [Candidatus Binatia bacterium]|nr:hypothetical protein [Candidatus Binatia bacterium]